MNIGNLNMNDWKTSDIVSCILNRMGYRILSKYAKECEEIDILIKFVKHKKDNFGFEIRDMINYFL